MLKHIPVLPQEVIQYLDPSLGKNYIDLTVGLGGHAKEILKKTSPSGRLLAIDQDSKAIEIAKKNLENFGERVDYVSTNFRNLGLIIREWPVKKIDGVLFDLGVSSLQLSSQRGFSFRGDAPLDMRMSDQNMKTAKEIINHASFSELKRLIWEYGEEPFAGKIAGAIVREREKRPIKTSAELLAVISLAIPERFRHGKINFATKTFQAFRMAVNDELSALENGLKQALQVLSPGGRLVVISFHSLEDRMVKNFLKGEDLQILTPKPIMATAEEIQDNPRARSAKLRAAEKN